ncbi:hypothetical protein F4804DRAFT_286109 [Jackrogersella minutella]|nr:hypothetical protein F4804DRAFT_286109 [Jackrogersella minutella]
MRILTPIDGSIYGAILSCRPSLSLSSLPSLYGTRIRDDYKEAIRPSSLAVTGRSSTIRPRKKHNASWITTFKRPFSSAVAVSGCRPSNFGFFYPNLPYGRENHTAANAVDVSSSSSPSQARTQTRPKKELLDIVDLYDDTSVEEHLAFLRDPYLRRYAPADGPNLTVSDRAEDINLQSVDHTQKLDPKETEAVRKLREAILRKLRRPATVYLDAIYELYQLLPEPRISHMTARMRHQLLAVLGMTENKDAKSMLRYFSVVTDVKNSGFALTREQWNTAISFASRYVGKSTEVELEAALHLWREMEKQADVRASGVTFNILFDVASKAGKFDLAEMIYQEMITRGFSFNRYHHVSLIHYFGLKQDTSGMRSAYKQMVELGEVIDSVVLNCVMSGFLRSGEESSAERVYEKMKDTARGTVALPDRNYTMQKNITKVLMMFAKLGKRHPDMRPNFQRTALIYPDLQTYRLLVNHYGPRLGNLSKVAQFLDEMKIFDVPLHGSIFLALFKAFGKHGNAGSDWTSERLISVYHAFLNCLDEKVEGLTISTWMAMSILRAFARFASEDQILAVYENLRARWKLDEGNAQFMMGFLKNIIQQPNFNVHSRGMRS